MLNLTCKTCRVDKPTDSFYINSNYRNGYRPVCKECMKLKYPSKYEKKPAEYFEQRRKERREEKEKMILEIKKAKLEKRLLEAPLRAEIAKQKKKLSKKKYLVRKRAEPFARRVEKINERCAGLGKLSKNIIKELFTSQNGKCAVCGVDITDSRHVDHILPIAKGGLNIDINVQLLCPSCNIKKSDIHPLLFKHGLKDIPTWLDPL